MAALQTSHCIHCARPAVMWTGHVLKDGKAVMAGFCGRRCLLIKVAKAEGLLGVYEHWMETEEASDGDLS